MKDFHYRLENIHSDAVTLDYFLVPWDTEILAKPVAEIKRLEIRKPEEADSDYAVFEDWCKAQSIALCNCCIAHDRLVESIFLEMHDFRFIELNYRPQLNNLQGLNLADSMFNVEPALYQDQELLAEMAGSAFRHGRFHQDPRLGSSLGNRRYKKWMLNAFKQSNQQVLKCSQNGEIIAFFVVEYPEPRQCFWSLVGLAPGLQGQGLGKRVWRAMLRWHQESGIDSIITSISSQNTAVFNLYVALGFRFPPPYMTFHWRPPRTQPLS